MNLTQGNVMFAAGVPTGNSMDAKGNTFALTVNYFLNGKDASGGLGTATIPVPNIMATMGLPNPTKAQAEAASKAKAMAIVNAVNGAKLPGVMASVNANTVPGAMYPTGMKKIQFVPGIGNVMVPVLAPANLTAFTIDGVRQSVLNNGKLGNPVHTATVNSNTGRPVIPNINLTGESGDGKANFKPGPSGNGGTPGSYKGTYNGSGSSMGSSTGLDPSGGDSVVGFGFIDETTDTPVDYIAAIDPTSGLNDNDVLSELAAVFNADFSSSGYTATYDTSSDTLSIDQMLPGQDILWYGNTDTGLFLDANTVVPEPASLALLALGGAVLLGLRRKRTKIESF